MPDNLHNAVEIASISEQHVLGFRHCLDAVARERKHLRLVEAPPPEATREFVLSNISKGGPQLVALLDGRGIGWCDIIQEG